MRARCCAAPTFFFNYIRERRTFQSFSCCSQQCTCRIDNCVHLGTTPGGTVLQQYDSTSVDAIALDFLGFFCCRGTLDNDIVVLVFFDMLYYNIIWLGCDLQCCVTGTFLQNVIQCHTMLCYTVLSCVILCYTCPLTFRMGGGCSKHLSLPCPFHFPVPFGRRVVVVEASLPSPFEWGVMSRSIFFCPSPFPSRMGRWWFEAQMEGVV